MIISYGESIPTGQGINYGQDILCGNEVIGWLETRVKNLLSPLSESYQFVINKEPPRKYAYSESESCGYWRLYFDTIDQFIAGYIDLVGQDNRFNHPKTKEF